MTVENSELGGLGEDANIPSTETTTTDADAQTVETPEQKIARLEEENKRLTGYHSDLGRKFKSFQEDVTGKFDTVMDKVSQLGSVPQKEPEPENNDYVDTTDPKYIDAMLEKKLNARDRQSADIREKYVRDYSKTVQAMGGELDASVYESIVKNMEGMAGYSNDGAMDAERNFIKAERDYYRNVSNSKTTTFKGQDPKGTGVGGSSTVATKDTTDEDVGKAMQDPHVQAYLKRRGKDAEFVKRAMKQKTPLSGKVSI